MFICPVCGDCIERYHDRVVVDNDDSKEIYHRECYEGLQRPPVGSKGVTLYRGDNKYPPMQPGRSVKLNTPEQLTEERGARYGHPRDHFAGVGLFKDEFRKFCNERAHTHERLDREQMFCYMHVIDMLFDKIIRSAHDPFYEDNWDDIMGYARTAKMSLKIGEFSDQDPSHAATSPAPAEDH